jgi:DNA polymerase-3 subunit beta
VTDRHRGCRLTQKQMKRLLALVQYAMAQQDIRYYLNGLLLVAKGNELRMVATDGHRLAYAAETLPEAPAPIEVILPRKTVLGTFAATLRQR